MSEPKWVTLLEIYDRLEAEIIKEALEAQGIPAELFQEGASHYIYPVSGPLGRIEVCVPDNRQEEARQWLEARDDGELESQAEEDQAAREEAGKPDEPKDSDPQH